jgi:hypothetical protein
MVAGPLASDWFVADAKWLSSEPTMALTSDSLMGFINASSMILFDAMATSLFAVKQRDNSITCFTDERTTGESFYAFIVEGLAAMCALR